VSTPLIRLGLFLLPLWSLAGVLCCLGACCFKSRPTLRLPPLSRLEKQLLLFLSVWSLFALWTAPQPLYHLAGWLSHYLLPALFCLWLYSGLQQGLLTVPQLERTLITSLCVLAVIATANYFADWHGQLRALPLPLFDRPFLIDLSLEPARGRASGPALNPNLLGLVMAMGLSLALKHSPLRAGLLLLALGVSFSRAAWLGGLSALLWLVCFRQSRKTASFALGAAAASLVLPGVQQRLMSLMRYEHSTNLMRTEIWQAGFKLLSDFPWSGVGILNVEQLYPAYQIATRGSAHLHHIPLQIAVESGLPFSLGLALLLFQLIKPLTAESAPWLCLMIFGCFDYPLADLRVQAILMILLALRLQARSAQKQESPSENMAAPERVC
jgi:O-antigen ligase